MGHSHRPYVYQTFSIRLVLIDWPPKAKEDREGCVCVGGWLLVCRCDSVALMMSWASVTQSNGRHMCSGSYRGGRGMGLGVSF